MVQLPAAVAAPPTSVLKRKQGSNALSVSGFFADSDSDNETTFSASDATSHRSLCDSYRCDAEEEAFALCEGAADGGDDDDAYGADVAQLLAGTGEDQDADGWKDCDVSGSEGVVECQLSGLPPPAASRQTSLSAGASMSDRTSQRPSATASRLASQAAPANPSQSAPQSRRPLSSSRRRKRTSPTSTSSPWRSGAPPSMCHVPWTRVTLWVSQPTSSAA